ncbi:MAG: phage tail tape measure protein, partial [Proteiniphilum sp.]|nr:phage tail tape measure protein [Proteiniphilum sp.]
MAVGELVVSIIGDMKELSKTFSSVQKELGDVGKKFNDVGKSISSAGTSLTKRFTAPIVGAGLAFAGVAKEGMEFEKGMAQVYTLIPDMSKEAFGQMSADTLQFAKDMKVPTEKVLPALYDAIGSGVPQDNVFSFLEVAQKGAVAGATNVGVAVDTLTSLINAYGAENLSAADASDILFAGINVGKMSYEELQKSLSQVVPTAASLQIPLEQVVGALAAMTAQGTPTAQSTTQLSRLFNELAKEGTSAYDTFKEISGKSFPQFIKEGGTVEDALKLMKDGFMENSPAAKELEKRMRELVDPTSGLSLEFESLTGKTFKDFRKEGGDVSEAFKILGINTEEADGRLSDMFGSIEAGNAVLTLTSRDGAILTDVMDEMDRSAGQTDEAFAKMSDTTSYAFESISAEIKNATTEMGVNLLPIIQDTIVPLIIDTLIPAFEWAVGVIATVADAFNKLPQPVKVVILAVIAFIAALGPVLVVIGAVVSAIGTLAAAFGTGGILAGAISFITATVLPALSTAFGILVYTVIPIVVEAIALLATPLGLVAVALAAFALAWKYNWFDIQGKFQSVKKIIETAMKNFSDFLQRLWHGLVMAAGRLSTNLSTIWDIIKTVFSSTGDTIIQIVSKLYDWLQSTYDS